MADQNIEFKVVADYQKAIKEWEQLRDKVASTNEEYQEAQKAIDDLKIAMSELTGEYKKSSAQLAIEKQEQQKATRAYKEREQAIKEAFNAQMQSNTAANNTINATSNLTNANKQLKDSTGAATATVLELGRVVQDAPYGIRGMANNITQLVSQFSFATKNAGGFMAALKQMIGLLNGPLGIVLAISAVVSALDYFFGGNKKVEKSTSDLSEELLNQIEILDSYNSALERGNLSLEEQSGIIDAITVSNKEFRKIIESTNGSLDEQIKAFKKFRLEKKQQLELDEKISRLSEINQELDKSNIDTIEEATNQINKLNKEKQIALSSAYGLEEEGINRAYNLQIIPLQNIIDKLKEQKNLLVDINSLSKGVQLIEKGSELQLKTELSELKEKQSRVEALTDAWYLYKIEIDEIEAKLKKISDFGKTKDPEKPKAKDRVSALFGYLDINKAEKEAKMLFEAIKKTYEKKPIDVLDGKNILSLGDEKAAKEYGEMIKNEIRKNIKLDNQLDAFSDYADLTKQALTSISDFTNAQFERDLVIEQNKTTALNEELNKRLLNENLSKDERARIQNEIAKNDEALRKKQNDIKRKQFNNQKAFNIATAVIDTGRAAAGVMADAKGGFFTRLAQAIPTIAFGLAQVATIASQKFQPDSANTPIRTSGGGAGGGAGDRSFNFNLVGNNRENQLANAIQGKFDQPIKAYVVSRDMSNQQQLDANIVNSARF